MVLWGMIMLGILPFYQPLDLEEIMLLVTSLAATMLDIAPRHRPTPILNGKKQAS